MRQRLIIFPCSSRSRFVPWFIMMLLWDPAGPGLYLGIHWQPEAGELQTLHTPPPYKSAWFAVEESTLHQRCRTAWKDVCGRARQFLCECAAGCVWNAAIPHHVSAAQTNTAWIRCWSWDVMRRKTESLLAYSRQIIIIIVFLVETT